MTTQERVEQIVEIYATKQIDKKLLRARLEALVLSARLDQINSEEEIV